MRSARGQQRNISKPHLCGISPKRINKEKLTEGLYYQGQELVFPRSGSVFIFHVFRGNGKKENKTITIRKTKAKSSSYYMEQLKAALNGKIKFTKDLRKADFLKFYREL